MISVVIATEKRAKDVLDCLNSLNSQALLPEEVIIAHGGGDRETKDLIEKLRADSKFKIKIKYFNFGAGGAAIQRNRGAENANGEIIFFLDDDVICDENFIKEVIHILNRDKDYEIGGVSGIISNSSYVPMSKFNKMIFDFALRKEDRRNEYAGRVVGPAVNFYPVDKPNSIQDVDWLVSSCCAYRKNVFIGYKFNEQFKGYSFMEDVELSCRIAKRYKLINTTNARIYHKDLGGKTHKNWVAIGKMQVLNRWHVMVNVLNKNSSEDKIRFFYYQIYCVITETRLLLEWPSVKYTLLRWIGRSLGIAYILFDEKYFT